MIAAKGAKGHPGALFVGRDSPPIGKKEHRAMTHPQLGRLERVDLATRWTGEACGFAPWFLDPDRLRRLGDALGLRLEPLPGALTAGPRRAGLACRDAGGSIAAIESQRGESGNAHLGALLVRAAESRAETAIWVAERFAREHREILECLNRAGAGKTGFFAVEMGLWRIGDSRPALRFDIVAAPQLWLPPEPVHRRGRFPCLVLAGG